MRPGEIYLANFPFGDTPGMKPRSRVGLKDSYLVEGLYHLRRNRWIVSLRRGLYAMSPSVPGVAPIHEFEIAMALVDPAALSHWSALHHHGLTEQGPRKVFVLTTVTYNAEAEENSYPDPDMKRGLISPIR